jgi:hypothetical protein
MPILIDVVAVSGMEGGDAVQIGEPKPRITGHGAVRQRAGPCPRASWRITGVVFAPGKAFLDALADARAPELAAVVRGSIAKPGPGLRLDEPVSANLAKVVIRRTKSTSKANTRETRDEEVQER